MRYHTLNLNVREFGIKSRQIGVKIRESTENEKKGNDQKEEMQIRQGIY